MVLRAFYKEWYATTSTFDWLGVVERRFEQGRCGGCDELRGKVYRPYLCFQLGAPTSTTFVAAFSTRWRLLLPPYNSCNLALYAL